MERANIVSLRLMQNTAVLVAAGVAAAVYILMEAIWLSLTVRSMYAPMFSGVLGREWAFRASAKSLLGALAAYVALGAGLLVLVLGDVDVSSYATLAVRAAVYGVAVYGTYNMTNSAVFERWGLGVSCVDTAWGAAVSVVSCMAAKFAATWYAGRSVDTSA